MYDQTLFHISRLKSDRYKSNIQK